MLRHSRGSVCALHGEEWVPSCKLCKAAEKAPFPYQAKVNGRKKYPYGTSEKLIRIARAEARARGPGVDPLQVLREWKAV